MPADLSSRFNGLFLEDDWWGAEEEEEAAGEASVSADSPAVLEESPGSEEGTVDLGDVSDLAQWFLSDSELSALQANLVKELGFGGYGTCSLVRLQDGSTAVLKQLHSYLAHEAATVLNEFRKLTLLDGLGGAPKPLGIHPQKGAVLMSAVGTETLERYLSIRSRDKKACRKLSHNLCARLVELKSKGVVHNDLKEDNVMVDEELNVFLIDFGLSTFEGERALPFSVLSNELSGAMEVRPWVAPEVLRGAPSTFAADAFSLGYVLEAIWRAYDVRFAGDEIERTPLFRVPARTEALIAALKARDVETRAEVPGGE